MIIICFGTVTRPLFLFNPLPMMFKTTKKRKNSSGNFQCGILPVQLRRPKLLFHQQVPRGANSLQICDNYACARCIVIIASHMIFCLSLLLPCRCLLLVVGQGTREFLTMDLGHAKEYNNLPFAESGFLCKVWQHLVWPCNALV